jgi:phosphoglycerate dehydrogenase-like enzyme
MKVLCTVDLPRAARERISGLGRDIDLSVLVHDAPGFAEALGEAEVFAGWVSPEELSRATRLRWLQLGSAGADGFVKAVAPAVILTTASGVFGPAIAEHVLGMMLALVRGIDRMVILKQEAHWGRAVPGLVRGGLSGKTLAIVGLGDIGRALAVRAKAFDMRVLGIRRRPSLAPPPGVDEVHTEDAIDAVLPRADHVVLALPATPRTDRLMDARRLALMKRGAYLYNVGRGNAVDEAALAQALRDGTLAGAGLDVFATEPLPSESPLYGLDNLVITPHVAGYTDSYAERFAALFVDNLRRYVAGQALENVVERERGY